MYRSHGCPVCTLAAAAKCANAEACARPGQRRCRLPEGRPGEGGGRLPAGRERGRMTSINLKTARRSII